MLAVTEQFPERAVRRVPFNVDAFLDVAVRSAGATKCTSFKKIYDGEPLRLMVVNLEYISSSSNRHHEPRLLAPARQ